MHQDDSQLVSQVEAGIAWGEASLAYSRRMLDGQENALLGWPLQGSLHLQRLLSKWDRVQWVLRSSGMLHVSWQGNHV